jgi:hypothetical protein
VVYDDGRQASAFLDVTYSDRWIGRNGPIPWPACSSDLNPLDFFLCGDLKIMAYETPIRALEI